MPNLLSKAITKVSSLLNRIQAKQFLPVILVVFLMLTANVDPGHSNKAVSKRLDQVIHQEDSQRPKTTGEWNQEARETQGAPGERLKRIGEESAEAIKDFGSLYPDTAQSTTSEPQNSNRTSR